MNGPKFATQLPPLNAAVFRNGDKFVLVRLETDYAERGPAVAAAQGFDYVGSIGLNEGVPVCDYEDGPGNAFLMLQAGYIFAGWLGEHLKNHQRSN